MRVKIFVALLAVLVLATLGMVSAFIHMAKTGISPVSAEECVLIANLALEVTDAAARGAGARILRKLKN